MKRKLTKAEVRSFADSLINHFKLLLDADRRAMKELLNHKKKDVHNN